MKKENGKAKRQKDYMRGFDDCLKGVKEVVKQKLVGGISAVDVTAGMTLDSQLFKVSTEYAELIKAAEEYKRKGTATNYLHLASESIDLQISVETLLSLLELTQEERDALRKDIGRGNQEVGYVRKQAPRIYRLYYGPDKDLEGEYETWEDMEAALKNACARDKADGIRVSYECEEYVRREVFTAYDAECGF